MIFGSSNLTAAGLVNQNELNICLTGGSSQFIDTFERLWQNARSINGQDFSPSPSTRSATRAVARSIGQQSAQTSARMANGFNLFSKADRTSKTGQPVCPIHKINMILRKGRQSQKEFWGLFGIYETRLSSALRQDIMKR